MVIQCGLAGVVLSAFFHHVPLRFGGSRLNHPSEKTKGRLARRGVSRKTVTHQKGCAMSLLDAARQVREAAYAPYSRFKVGAAVRGASGRIYAGCNVENVAYPEGTCAEAGAIAAMVAAGETQLIEVAVIADAPSPVPPCGGCRQKLAEFGRGDTPVLMATVDGATTPTTIGELLPGRFDPAHMERAE
ncbi:cytidine deaminase [Paracoccus sp. (in: a-proteobacteria)]|uniref:cytidine deaminase n=1 Tax=Paracoccus sp. TaxID=267 RepID=UPI0026DF5DE3|nr:cytidine deaminase [Paracoccus sp. (in: a-proteobacteria)]MDO5648054.1 cytidine deaminase [Paracoccus sp. (in: a-proteobacteria)]